MSKSTVKKRNAKKLASKMGMYTTYSGDHPVSGHKFTKPGSSK